MANIRMKEYSKKRAAWTKPESWKCVIQGEDIFTLLFPCSRQDLEYPLGYIEVQPGQMILTILLKSNFR